MKKTNVKRINYIRIFVSLLALVLIFASTSCDILNSDIFGTTAIEKSKGITVKYLDVGQGDGALIMTENKTLLIDAGPNENDTLVNCLNDYGIKYIDYIIATHPHSDHIGGMDEAIDFVEDVGTVYMPELPENLVPTSATYNKFLKAVLGTNARVISPENGESFEMDGAIVTFLGPCGEFDNLNDSSIVVRIDYMENSFLFTGDCTSKAFKRILNSEADVSADVLKVSHHGSNNATNQKIFEQISPIYAVISCGIDNSYNHPHSETLEILTDNETEYYRTDYNGTVTIVGDGEKYTVEYEKGVKNGK